MRACVHVGMFARWRAGMVLVAVFAGAPAATAIPCAWCATEVTQIMNNVELLGVNATQARALATQFRQLELQVRNARRLQNPQAALEVATAFGRLVRIIETTRGASVHAAGVDQRYRGEFGGFVRYAGQSRPTAETMESRYRKWSEVSHQNIRAALRSAGLHAAAFYDEQTTLRALERQAVGADGMLKVTQAGAQIAAMQVEEGRKLRALLTAQVQMQGNLAAASADRQDASDADRERYRRFTPSAEEPRRVGIEELRRR